MNKKKTNNNHNSHRSFHQCINHTINHNSNKSSINYLFAMVVFPHQVRPISSSIHLSIVKTAVLVFTTFSWTSMTAGLFCQCALATRTFPCRVSRVSLCLSFNVLDACPEACVDGLRLPRPHRTNYGKFHAACNRVTRTGGLIACSAYTGHGQCVAPADLAPVVPVAADAFHTCAVRADRRLICFGWNGDRQCDVPADLGPVLAVSASGRHTCAVRADGRLICFGSNAV